MTTFADVRPLPAYIRARRNLIEAAAFDLEDFTGRSILTETDQTCLECGDVECDGDAHYEDETENYACEECGHYECECEW